MSELGLPDRRIAEPRPGDRRDLLAVDEVAQEGRLGQDLDVEEIRRRLPRDRLQLLPGVMQAARRVDVDDRDRKEDAKRPSQHAIDQARRSLAIGVVAVVDRLQERFEVPRRPGLGRGGDQDEGLRRPFEAAADRLVEPAVAVDVDRADLDLAKLILQEAKQAVGDRLGVGRRPEVDDEGEHRGARQRLAAVPGLVGIVVERARVVGHFASRLSDLRPGQPIGQGATEGRLEAPGDRSGLPVSGHRDGRRSGRPAGLRWSSPRG